MDRLIVFCATGLGVGYIKWAPGTWGSLFALLLWWPISIWLSHTSQIILIISFLLFGVFICSKAAIIFNREDDGRVVIDEWVGMWLSMYLLPYSLTTAITAFALFRFFDILKPQPIAFIDNKIAGGWGVMLDDVLAAIYANLTLRFIALPIIEYIEL